MDAETLRRASSFVSTESGFQCATITNAQYAAARRRIESKLEEFVDERDQNVALRPAPREGRKTLKQQPPTRTSSAGQVRGYSGTRLGNQ